jgi:predicted transcriptional regulator
MEEVDMIEYEDFDDIRKKLHLTNTQAAQLLGVSRRTLSNYAKGAFPSSVKSEVNAVAFIGGTLADAKKASMTASQIVKLITKALAENGVAAIEDPHGSLFDFLLLNLNALKKVSQNLAGDFPLHPVIMITATTSLSDAQENDDEAALYIKAALDLENRESVVVDSSELKKRILSGKESIPEPLICVGPPERNYFTLVFGNKRVNLSDDLRVKYGGRLLPEIDMTICKVAGKAIYIVFTDNEVERESASQLIADMIIDGDLDMTPGSMKEGDALPPLRKRAPAR